MFSRKLAEYTIRNSSQTRVTKWQTRKFLYSLLLAPCKASNITLHYGNVEPVLGKLNHPMHDTHKNRLRLLVIQIVSTLYIFTPSLPPSIVCPHYIFTAISISVPLFNRINFLLCVLNIWLRLYSPCVLGFPQSTPDHVTFLSSVCYALDFLFALQFLLLFFFYGSCQMFIVICLYYLLWGVCACVQFFYGSLLMIVALCVYIVIVRPSCYLFASGNQMSM